MDSEEPFATLHHAIPPNTGYMMRLLCAHKICKHWESLIQLLCKVSGNMKWPVKKLFPSSLLHKGAKEGEALARAAFPGSGSCWLSPLLCGTPMTSLQSFIKVCLQDQPVTHVTARSPSHVPLGKHLAETLWVRASFQKMCPKERCVFWRLLNVLCGVSPPCALKGPAPAGVNPSPYTSARGAINRLGDKTKGNFLKMEDTTSTVCGSGNCKRKAGLWGNLKAVDFPDAVGLREGNAVTLRIFSLFCFTKAGCCSFFQIKPTYIYGDGWLLGREVCIPSVC